MKEKTKSNSGFTLIELIIAMAILAFLMTAISSFMGTGVLSFKKAKSDISVHNSAQAVYDSISESVMSANELIICAYVVKANVNISGADDFKLPDDPLEVEFAVAGDECNVPASELGLYYFVKYKDDAGKTIFDEDVSLEQYKLDGVDGILTYDQVPEGATLYVKQIIVDSAVPIDFSYCSQMDASKNLAAGADFVNAFTGKTVKIKEKTRMVVDESGKEVEQKVVSKAGPVYDTYDTQRSIYTFNGEDMYLEHVYAYMDKLDDKAASRSYSAMKNHKFSEAFNYMVVKSGAEGVEDSMISACTASFDAGKRAMKIDLKYSDKNMTYVSKGMINTRNTYVLRPKPAYLLDDDSTE